MSRPAVPDGSAERSVLHWAQELRHRLPLLYEVGTDPPQEMRQLADEIERRAGNATPVGPGRNSS